MNSDASMEYDYAQNYGNEPPHLPFGLQHMQAASLCPAITARRSGGLRPDLPNPHQYYGFPPSNVFGGFAGSSRVYAPQQWSYHQQAIPHIGESPSGPSEPGQARNTAAIHQHRQQGYPTIYPSYVSPSGTVSLPIPTDAAPPGISTSFLPRFSSSPSTPNSVLPIEGGRSAVDNPGGDNTARPAGFSDGSPVANASAPPSEAVISRGAADPLTILQGSGRLLVPSNQNARQASSPYQSDRDTATGRLRPVSVATAATTASSPASSQEDDSDFGAGARNQLFLHYFRNTRQSQILRGQMSNKRVASRKALQSLEMVVLDSLPDNERTCVICYNDFGVASPEGTVETPLRLPKCKHVFGDKCILKWLEDSCSCPYCRDKLESEPVRPNEAILRRLLEAETEHLLHASSSLRRMMAATHGRERLYAPERAHAAARRNREHDINREIAARGERRAVPSAQSGDIERRARSRYESMHAPRTATYESPQNSVNALNTPATSAVQPQNPVSQVPLSRVLPAWQPHRHMESQSLLTSPQSNPSPAFMPHGLAGAQPPPSTPMGFGTPFAPLPPPIAITSYPHAVPNAQAYVLPPFIPQRDYHAGHVMPNHNSPESIATPGMETGFQPPPHTPSQLPGFPDLLSQLPREANSGPASYSRPGPL